MNIPISTGQSIYQIPLIQPENIKWGLENGYRYIHIGIIQFIINPLVRPDLNTSCLTCVLDTRMNNFNDALLGGFQNPLNNGPVWSSVIPRYQVSLRDPYINEFLNAYIQFYGFNVAPQSQIAQLYASICLRFVSTSMPPLNPKLAGRALKEGVIVSPGNTTPLHIGFAECTLLDEWNSTYIPLSQKYPQLQTSKVPTQLSLIQHRDGSSGLRFINPSLTRSVSSLPRSTFFSSRNPHIPSVPIILSSRHSAPREEHRKYTSHKPDDF